MTKTNTPQQALLFIPDISGFTEFVNTTDISHSQHIIEELLEILIDSNTIDLELSEIEGDALLFYRIGKAPTAAELLAQIQKMYANFHSHLMTYEKQRICSCGACSAVNKLSLKFVSHYGEIALNQIKDRSKLFGKDVIVAHRLLKNNIQSSEYSLFTAGLTNAYSTWLNLPEIAWSKVEELNEEYDFGQINYSFVALDPLKEHIPEPKLEDYSIKGATAEIMKVKETINAPIEMVFDVLSDLSFRHEFTVGLIGSDKLNHKVAQNGSSHRCVINANERDPLFFSHDYEFEPKKITFAESNYKNQFSNVYQLIPISNNTTEVHITTFTKPNFLKLLVFKTFLKKKFIKNSKQTLANLNDYVVQLASKNEQHPNQIQIPNEVLDAV